MDKDESCQLLRAMLSKADLTPEELPILASRLEYLPLALVQVIAFIQENITIVGDYLWFIN